MILTNDQLALLRDYGFMWLKDHSTDRVAADHIKDIVPAANGFTVVYSDDPKVVLKFSTAQVESIEFPKDLTDKWIMVTWVSIVDERKPGK